jgi:DNA polymerase-3 subunit gamma/tau
MAPDLVQLSQHQLDALSDQARRLGPARIVRGIERLGEILVELRHAPDPRVLVEVALVQLSAEPEAGADDIGALAARLTKLEQAVAAGPAAGAGSGPVDPSTGRAVLGGRARRGETEPAPLREAGAAAAAVADNPPAPAAPAAPVPSGALEQQWRDLRPTLKGRARALYTPVDLVGASDDEPDVVTLAVPNATHQAKCEEHRDEVEQAWRAASGRPITIRLVVRDEPGVSSAALPADRDVEPDVGDPADLVDAPAGSTQSAVERLAQAFPGAQLVEGGRE